MYPSMVFSTTEGPWQVAQLFLPGDDAN